MFLLFFTIGPPTCTKCTLLFSFSLFLFTRSEKRMKEVMGFIFFSALLFSLSSYILAFPLLHVCVFLSFLPSGSEEVWERWLPEPHSSSCGLSSLFCPGSSAPAYYDIVSVFRQSIAFNRAGAHWPNWKESRPPFYQSQSRAGCRAYRALGDMGDICGFSLPHIFSPVYSPLFHSFSFFLSHCLMPSDGCENISREMSILFPINPFHHFHAGVPIDSETERKSTLVSKKNVLIFHFFASYFWNMSYMCDFSFQVCHLYSFVEDRTWKEPSL